MVFSGSRWVVAGVGNGVGWERWVVVEAGVGGLAGEDDGVGVGVLDFEVLAAHRSHGNTQQRR